MESSIADFVQFRSAFAKFSFLEWRLGTLVYVSAQFRDFLEFFSFPKILSLKYFGN